MYTKLKEVIKTKLSYPAIFSPFENKGGYTVVFPDLLGCVTEGNSKAAAYLMAIDAAQGWIQDEIEDGRIIPAPSSCSSIQVEPDEFVLMVEIEI